VEKRKCGEANNGSGTIKAENLPGYVLQLIFRDCLRVSGRQLKPDNNESDLRELA
jgi:hypothetical protein